MPRVGVICPVCKRPSNDISLDRPYCPYCKTGGQQERDIYAVVATVSVVIGLLIWMTWLARGTPLELTYLELALGTGPVVGGLVLLYLLLRRREHQPKENSWSSPEKRP